MFKVISTACMAAFLPLAASAATISVSIFDPVTYNGTFGVLPSATETFETLGRPEGQVGASLATAVGTFASLGGTGTGGTVTGGSQPAGNTGTELALRNGNVFGRTNTTPAGGQWFLDSNDTWGMTWAVSAGGKLFDRLTFSMMDANDAGAHLRITTGTDSFETRTVGATGNGNIKLVEIKFASLVSSATVLLGNYTTSGGTRYKLNDGFSIDGVQVFTGTNLSQVPVPASMVLLGSALAGIGALRRRKTAAKA